MKKFLAKPLKSRVLRSEARWVVWIRFRELPLELLELFLPSCKALAFKLPGLRLQHFLLDKRPEILVELLLRRHGGQNIFLAPVLPARRR